MSLPRHFLRCPSGLRADHAPCRGEPSALSAKISQPPGLAIDFPLRCRDELIRQGDCRSMRGFSAERRAREPKREQPAPAKAGGMLRDECLNESQHGRSPDHDRALASRLQPRATTPSARRPDAGSGAADPPPPPVAAQPRRLRRPAATAGDGDRLPTPRAPTMIEGPAGGRSPDICYRQMSICEPGSVGPRQIRAWVLIGKW